MEKVIAPCMPDGVVNSVWDDEMYALEDNDSKEAECRCAFSSCYVNERNEVIQRIVLNAGRVDELRQSLIQNSPI